jgi:hypothetical protein
MLSLHQAFRAQPFQWCIWAVLSAWWQSLGNSLLLGVHFSKASQLPFNWQWALTSSLHQQPSPAPSPAVPLPPPYLLLYRRYNDAPSTRDMYINRLYNITRNTCLNINNCDWLEEACPVSPDGNYSNNCSQGVGVPLQRWWESFDNCSGPQPAPAAGITRGTRRNRAVIMLILLLTAHWQHNRDTNLLNTHCECNSDAKIRLVHCLEVVAYCLQPPGVDLMLSWRDTPLSSNAMDSSIYLSK